MQELAHRIQVTRHYGWLIAQGFDTFSSAADMHSKLLSQCNIKFENLQVVPIALAKKILYTTIYRDLAYRSDLMTSKEAQDFCDEFFAFFPEKKLKCYSNGQFDEHDEEASLVTWNPQTERTFDTGVVVHNGTHFGVLWFADED